MTKPKIEETRRASLQSAATKLSDKYNLEDRCEICAKPLKKGIYAMVSIMAQYFDGVLTHTDDMYRGTMAFRQCHLHCAERMLNVRLDTKNLNDYGDSIDYGAINDIQ